MSAQTLDEPSTAITEARPGGMGAPEPAASAEEGCSIASAPIPCYGTE